jgi:hypothetical protein
MANIADTELTLRITVVKPLPDVWFRLQRGPGELEPAVRTSATAMTFEFPVRVGTRSGGAPNFLGPFVQGPPTGRFVYINSGTMAGQPDTCWSRRAKVPLTGITWALIDRARKAGSVLETDFAGTGGDGGPTCGTISLRDPDWPGWRVAAQAKGK